MGMMIEKDDVILQLLEFASRDENIRALVINGSRANPNVKADALSDYDCVCFVQDLAPYINDKRWISQFGDLVIMQFNRHDQYPEQHIFFLMQFDNGVRIDLSFAQIDLAPIVMQDSLTVVLLDKDNFLPHTADPSEASYILNKPTREEYDFTVNEFWWVSLYVAKALWRNQPLTAKYFLDVVVRPCLICMTDWFIAMQHDWAINVGKYGRHYEKFLTADLLQEMLQTYTDANIENNWDALFRMGDLMRKLAGPVAEGLGYRYPDADDRKATAYAVRIKNLKSVD